MASTQLHLQHPTARVHQFSTRRVAPRVVPFTAARHSKPTAVIRNVDHSQNFYARRQLVVVRAEATSEHPFPEEEDFDQLSNKVAELQQYMNDELKGCSLYLVGMMGSGKSTVGKMLANTLKYKFFDTDTMVELAHEKKPVSEIFKEFGEDYFRNCETEVLRQLSPYKNLVVATGGGAVLKPQNWGHMQTGVVAWLNGPTDLLANRVAKDGLEKRPLLAVEGETPSEEALYAAAKGKLDSLLEARTKYYENADLTISLEGYGMDADKGAPTAVVMYRLLSALKQKIEKTKQEREDRKNFTIINEGDVPSMRTMQAPVQPEDEPQP